MNWKRILAMGLLCILLMTDQSVAYAVENHAEAVEQEKTEGESEDMEASVDDTDVSENNGDEEKEEPADTESPEDGAEESSTEDSDQEKGDSGENGTDAEITGPSEGEPANGEDLEGEDAADPSEEETLDGADENENQDSSEEKPSEEIPDADAGDGEEQKPSEETPDANAENSEEESPEEETPDIPQETIPEGEPEEGTAIVEEEVSEPVTAVTEPVRQAVSVSDITVAAIPEQFYTGNEICPKLTLTDSKGTVLIEGTHYTAAYSSNINAGEATVKITGIEANGYTGSVEKKFVISPFSIDSSEIVYGGLDEDYPYTGKTVTPALTLTRNGTVLQKGTDYSVSYSNNKEIGTAKAVITGLGNYTGKAEKTFEIAKRKMSSDKISVVFTDGKSSYTYTGKTIKPAVTVKYNGKKLTKGTDYKVTYSNNKNAGTAKVKITGMGIYSGSCTKTFKIKPVNVSKLKISKFSTYSYLKTASINTTVKFGSTKLKKGTDYTISFKSSVKKGSNTVVIKGKGNFTGSKNMTVKVTFSDSDKVSLSSCTASSWNADTGKLTVKIKTGSISTLKKLNSTFYIVQLNSLGTSTRKRVKASFSGNYLQAAFKVTDGGAAAMMSKYAVAVKFGSKYQIITKTSAYISNPEKTATMTEPYNGYYEDGGKVTSKKGIQGASEDYLEDLGAQHVLLNMDIADMISTKKKSGFVAYKYNGKTYYFQDMIAWVQTLRYLNGWDNDNPYGWHRRSVTVVLLLSYKSELSYLIHPSAREKGAAPYYALNMKEKKARETFEAFFCYLGEKLGDNKKSRVCNWTLGNEVNACNAWNYSGGMSLEECVENYADAFQLLYQGVRRTASTSRVFISLDHSWTVSTDGHSGKKFLDTFASYMNKTAKNMQWNVNYHPYSQPLTRTDFWNDSSNTKSSSSTPYISMKNIKVLTDYLGKIETKYKMKSGSIRVILGEQGFSAVKGKSSQEKAQAAALGYGYYIAAFNSRIDAYIIRTYLDDKEETKSGLYLGLMSSSHKKKKAYDVYKYVDTVQSAKYMKPYLSTVEISSWKKKISNFKESKLNTGDF